MEQVQKPVKIWRRKNIHLVSEENDIKFRGPLSYRHLRIAGWFFLLISQLGVILGLAANARLLNINDGFLNVLKSANSLMTPLFLFAAFSQVLVAKDGYHRLLRTYGLGALGMYVLFLVIYLHFSVGLINAALHDYSLSESTARAIFSIINSGGAFAFNIFIDLILCTLVTFFINYRPKKHFQDKKIYIFRALVAIPLLYEVGSITLKLLASGGVFYISPFLLPLLTTKPPVAFIIFIVLALFVKNREKHYIKHGKTHKDYKRFLNTNVNRLHFSLFLVTTIVIAVILDILLFVGVFLVELSMMLPGSAPEAGDLIVATSLQNTYALGFGGCLPMILIIPLLIFFDYTKTYDNKIIDVIIPVVGVALLAVLYIEGMFEILRGLVFKLSDKIKEIINSDDSGEEPLEAMIRTIKHFMRR